MSKSAIFRILNILLSKLVYYAILVEFNHRELMLRNYNDLLYKSCITDCLLEHDLLFLLLTNKRNRDLICQKLIDTRNIPWNKYTQNNTDTLKKYDSVRDYLIFSHIKTILKYDYNFDKILFLVKELHATKYLLEKQNAKAFKQDDNENWQNLHKGLLKQINADNKFQDDTESKQIAKVLLESSAIVVSFNTANIKLNYQSSEYLKNTFQIAAERSEVKGGWDYFYGRITIETILFSSATPQELQLFTLQSNLRPTYGTLQFYNCITPITFFGTSFLVLTPNMRYSATAVFGDSLERIAKTKISPGLLAQPHSLIQQFPSELKEACKTLAATGLFPKEYSFQYKKRESKYIEVQLPPNIKIHDPEKVMHIHCSFDQHMPELEHISTWMKNGMTVSIGKNPFEDSNYAKAYQKNEIKPFLIDQTVKYFYQTMLIVGETEQKYLTCQHLKSENKLRFNFTITPNQPQFHQAQAWLVLKLLNVQGLQPEPMCFFPKNNIAGCSFDYSKDYTSLNRGLDIFLNRLLNTFLVCQLNLQYYQKNKNIHPIFGKGPTEESYHTQELFLNDGLNTCSIQTMWLYDYVLLKLRTDSQNLLNFVYATLKCAFNTLESCGTTILINSPLSHILEVLDDRCNYFTSIIIDKEEKNNGNVLLALRKNHWDTYPLGYSTSGGHNNSPYTYLDVYTDNEFGKLESKDLNHIPIISHKAFPRTAYVELSNQELIERKEDAIEFVPKSLCSFAFYELGNLKPEQLSEAAAHFRFTVEKYKEHFGNALALRPVDSLYFYLDHLHDQINELIKNECESAKVCIDKTVTEKIHTCSHMQGKFWLPSPNFGAIEIQNIKKEILIKYIYYLEIKNIKYRIRNDYSLIINTINPHTFYQFLESIKQSPIPTTLEMMEFAVALDVPFEYIRLLSFPANHHDIKSLLATKADVDNQQTETKLPYHTEYNSRLALIELLLKIPKQGINITDKDGNTALHLACQSKEYGGLVNNLLAQKPNLEIRNKENQNIWFLALQAGLMNVINLLRVHEEKYPKQQSLELKPKAASNQSILHLLFKNHFNCDEKTFDLCAEYLIKKFASDVNLANASGRTPLHIAAGYNYIPQIQFLLLAKADANAMDLEGNTPLHCVIKKDSGFEFDEQDVDDEQHIIHSLFHLGKANLNAQNKSGNTPLHFAALHKQRYHASYLLELKANANIKNNAGDKPKLPDPDYKKIRDRFNLFYKGLQLSNPKEASQTNTTQQSP